MLLLGWIGPLGLSPAWYANIPLLFSNYRMLKGLSPGWILPLMSVSLAFTALFPHLELETPNYNWQATKFVGPAIPIWLAAFVVSASAVLLDIRPSGGKRPPARG